VDDVPVVFTDPWIDLRGGGADEEAQRRELAAELRREVAKGHPLFGQEVAIVARCTARDDVVAATGDNRWVLVHLTWRRRERPPWPIATFFDTATALEAELRQRDP
jgi:hypothetical protein